jgi:hypothetical protein
MKSFFLYYLLTLITAATLNTRKETKNNSKIIIVFISLSIHFFFFFVFSYLTIRRKERGEY